MNYHPNNNWRNRRNLLNHQNIGAMAPFGRAPYSSANYSTDTKLKKTEMQEHFRDDILLNKLHMIPNPLQKNLADTIVTSQHMQSKINETNKNNMATKTEKTADNTNDYHTTFSGIASFISSVFNVISGSIFQRQTKSEMECFDKEFDVCSHTFNTWQSSNFEDLNKNSLGDDQFSTLNIDIGNINHSEMINDCHNAAKQCEDKLGKVRLLLSSGVIPVPPKSSPRRPRRVFVEPSSVEDNFEDACCPEDFSSFPNETGIEYTSPCNIQNQELYEVDAPKIKTEASPVHKNMEVVSNVDLNNVTENDDRKLGTPKEAYANVTEPQVIISCEQKLNKLKTLLNEKKSKCRTPVCTPDYLLEQNLENKKLKVYKDKSSTTKVKDKRFKNPHKLRTSKKAHLQRNIHDDMSFANEIDSNIFGFDNTPPINPILSNEICEIDNLDYKDYFDEISGRFHSSSTTESDDSFQIVFTDSPKHRTRKMSDCDSEDSFIVFEDPLDCYTSTDVFGDYTDSEYSDSESEYSDSGCAVVDLACKLSHALSRTVSDLTDDSLYEDRNKCSESIDSDSEDKINSSPKMSCQEIPKAVKLTSEIKNIKDVQPDLSTGLLINEAKKLQRRKNPPKKVQFSNQPPKVHVMRVWAFAARQARMGDWERHALDRDRFKRRIADVEMAVSWVLKPQHRSRVMFQRFMPWWNAQKRKEIEEKKLKEDETKNLRNKNLDVDETKILQDTNLYDKVNDIPVNSVVRNVANNNNNVNDLVVGIGDKKIINNLDNKIENVKNIESGQNKPKKVDDNVANENCRDIINNIDVPDKNVSNYNTELMKTSNCTTLESSIKNYEEKECNNAIDTPFVNGFNERTQKLNYSVKNDIYEKRNEIFVKPEFISKVDSKIDFIKKKNECNDKLPNTNVGCNIKSNLSVV